MFFKFSNDAAQQHIRILSLVFTINELYRMKFPGESCDASISSEDANDRTNSVAK